MSKTPPEDVLKRHGLARDSEDAKALIARFDDVAGKLRRDNARAAVRREIDAIKPKMKRAMDAAVTRISRVKSDEPGWAEFRAEMMKSVAAIGGAALENLDDSLFRVRLSRGIGERRGAGAPEREDINTTLRKAVVLGVVDAKGRPKWMAIAALLHLEGRLTKKWSSDYNAWRVAAQKFERDRANNPIEKWSNCLPSN